MSVARVEIDELIAAFRAGGLEGFEAFLADPTALSWYPGDDRYP